MLSIETVNKTSWYRRYLSGIIVSFLLLASGEVRAEELQLKVEPEKLNLAGTKGSKIQRTLILTANRAIAPDNLEISFRDLYRTDEIAVFPAAAQRNLNAKQNSNLEYKIPLEFDLEQTSSKGEFSGQIVLRYQQQAEIVEVINLPVTTKIKSNWHLPLLCLLVGNSNWDGTFLVSLER